VGLLSFGEDSDGSSVSPLIGYEYFLLCIACTTKRPTSSP